MPISIAILPTFQADDYFLAVKLLFSPWNYFNRQKEVALRQKIKEYFNGKHVFLFDSGRTSLFILLKAMGFAARDEILLQAFTCVVVPNAVRGTGATPIYVDVDDNLNLSAADMEKKITPRSRAVIIQHSFGLPAETEEISRICQAHNLILIEDLAHALGNYYQGKPLGTFGKASILSFGRDKVISGICGGAILTNDENLAKEVEKIVSALPYRSFFWVLRQLCYPLCMLIVLNTYSFFGLGKLIHFALNFLKILPRVVTREEKRGEKSEMFYVGLPGALSALALNQLKKLDVFTAHRKKIAQVYASSLKSTFNGDCSYLRYNIFVDEPRALREFAAKRNIFLGDWYNKVVAPKDVELDKVDYVAGSCPQAENSCRKIVNLPTNPNMGLDEARRVVETVNLWKLKK